MGASPDILSHPSPNFGPRRSCEAPSLIVLHYTAMASAEAALARLCDLKAEVSAHYLVSAQGKVYQLVSEQSRAWHAGAGQWGAITDVNSHSIGIELDNLGTHPFAAPQMDALERLLADIMARWSIPPAGVIAHADMAPNRKTDPGPRFDWCRLAKQGLAVWPDDATAEDRPWQDTAAAFGYPAQPQSFSAFRTRFRPWAKGPEDAEDRRIMARLTAP